MRNRFGRSQLQWTLSIGFGLIIIIIAFSWYDNRHHIGDLYQIIESSRKASEKMEIIASMIETARTRSRLTNKMIHADDVFIKDEISMELNKHATQFSLLRQSLIELGLSEEEQKILNYQREAILPTLALQRQAEDMALSDDPFIVAEAQKILIEDVYVGQGVIIDFFMELLQLQKSSINNASIKAEEKFENAVQFELWLFSITLFLASTIAFFVIRRTAQIENALRLEKEKAQTTLKSIGDAVITTDKHGNIEYMNPIAEYMTGYLDQNILGSPIEDVFKAYDEVNKCWLSDSIMEFLRTKKYTMPSNDVTLITRANDKVDIAVSISPIQCEKNSISGMIATFHDISVAKSLAKKLEHQARHDPLTGLLNRREFECRVNQFFELFSEETHHSLCVIDLDRFKIVNDTVGHTAGDELLKQISKRIKQQLRASDLFARIGGDEFAIFLSNIDQKNTIKITKQILDAVREYQFYWNKKTFRVGASIGVVDASPGSSDFSYLLHAADTACYIAKHEGRDRVHIVSGDDQWLTQKRQETHWATRIEEALDKNHFVLYSQDIYDLKTRNTTYQHKEVLIRLKEEDGTIVLPMAFIPSAERYNLMSKVDKWVVTHVIEIIRNSSQKIVYNVNLSGQSMGDKKFTKKIMDLLKESNIDTSRLCFEITETAAIANLENAQQFLDDLQALGCQTALDDFGSGLSSFAYLRNLNIDYLKIDGMFIRQITEDATCKVMVESIHAISQTMKLKTVAEYVENQDIMDILEKIGIDYAQGYYIGKPEPLIYDISNIVQLNKNYGTRT